MGIAVADQYGGQQFQGRLYNPSCSSSASAGGDRRIKVCFYWKAGRCNRHPCPFLHTELLDGPTTKQEQRAHHRVWRNPDTADAVAGNKGASTAAAAAPSQPRTQVKKSNNDNKSVCKHFIAGKNCALGERCKFLHTWFAGNTFSLLASLQGHGKAAITGIAFPSGSNKLYSGSHDETVRAWDCHTGQCLGDVNMGGKVGCLISEDSGPWIFVGVPNAVKACNTQTSAILSLDGPVGQVYAMAVAADLRILFAGTHDGRILAWKFILESCCFEPAAALTGHKRSVVSLVIGAGRLYSGSMDNTIKVWDPTTLQCLHTLHGHTDVVMSLLCWEQFLFSGSLDGTVKVWAATESGELEVVYSHSEDHGVIALSGMPDAHGKPVLLCACNDNTLRLYNLPSFSEQGRIFAKEEIRSISTAPVGLFFTGDATGVLKVWKWVAEEEKGASAGVC